MKGGRRFGGAGMNMHLRRAERPRTSQSRGHTLRGDSWSHPFPINVEMPLRDVAGLGVRMWWCVPLG